MDRSIVSFLKNPMQAEIGFDEAQLFYYSYFFSDGDGLFFDFWKKKND